VNEIIPPSILHMGAQENVCSDTTNGWLWYCDVHDTHGNADSQDEADLLADTHAMFMDDEEGCDLVIWQRTPHERSKSE